MCMTSSALFFYKNIEDENAKIWKNMSSQNPSLRITKEYLFLWILKKEQWTTTEYQGGGVRGGGGSEILSFYKNHFMRTQGWIFPKFKNMLRTYWGWRKAKTFYFGYPRRSLKNYFLANVHQYKIIFSYVYTVCTKLFEIFFICYYISGTHYWSRALWVNPCSHWRIV